MERTTPQPLTVSLHNDTSHQSEEAGEGDLRIKLIEYLKILINTESSPPDNFSHILLSSN